MATKPSHEPKKPPTTASTDKQAKHEEKDPKVTEARVRIMPGG